MRLTPLDGWHVCAPWPAAARHQFEHTLGWLNQWACSRSFGLGTRCATGASNAAARIRGGRGGSARARTLVPLPPNHPPGHGCLAGCHGTPSTSSSPCPTPQSTWPTMQVRAARRCMTVPGSRPAAANGQAAPGRRCVRQAGQLPPRSGTHPAAWGHVWRGAGQSHQARAPDSRGKGAWRLRAVHASAASMCGARAAPCQPCPSQVWDFIFLGGATPQACAIPEEPLQVSSTQHCSYVPAGAGARPSSSAAHTPSFSAVCTRVLLLQAMRREFEYWYPFDLRVSGKDLIQVLVPGALARPGCRGWGRAVARAPLPTCLLAALCCCQNHLTFALYNHTAIWASKPEVRAGGACAPTPAWAQGMPRAPCCVVLAAGNAVQRPPAPECREDEQVHGCAEGGRMPVGQRCSPSL